MSLKELRQNWKGGKILILGFGREGMDTFLFLKKLFPKRIFGIADKNKKVSLPSIRARTKIRWHLGPSYLKAIKNYDFIFKSPGIPARIIEPYLRPGQKVTTQTQVFFENCPGTIVGITGTKGKSTTTALIYNILKKGRVKAHLVGNIGRPVLSLLSSSKKNDVYVYELSSHQLCDLKKSPHIAVLLNLYPEHLDYYKDFQEYSAAKANITLHQNENDFLIYNQKDENVKKIADRSKAQKIPVQGEYYNLDKRAAEAVGELFKIKPKTIKKAFKEFKNLPHRLELVGTFRGITFYNDALSTIPEATIGAIDKLGGKVQTIMLGGFDRKIKFNGLAKRILKSRIKNIILFPTTGEKIWKEIEKQNGVSPNKKLNHFFVEDMRSAVKFAYKNTDKGKICLLSTASSSFSIFKDYKEKGNSFKKFVRMYGKERA